MQAEVVTRFSFTALCMWGTLCGYVELPRCGTNRGMSYLELKNVIYTLYKKEFIVSSSHLLFIHTYLLLLVVVAFSLSSLSILFFTQMSGFFILLLSSCATSGMSAVSGGNAVFRLHHSVCSVADTRKISRQTLTLQGIKHFLNAQLRALPGNKIFRLLLFKV